MSNFDEIDVLVRAGLYGRALKTLDACSSQLKNTDSVRYDVLSAELLYRTGEIVQASTVAINLLSSASLNVQYRSRLSHTIGLCRLEDGACDDALEYIQRAVRFADEANDPALGASAQLSLLRIGADPDVTAAPLLTNARRSTARSGDPHLMVALRLHFARAEASRQSVLESRRHLSAADRLVQVYPNVSLKGRIELGFAVADSLTGNLHDAVQHARAAIEYARESGHARVELSGYANLSHALQAIGQYRDARTAAEEVLRRSRGDCELKIAALDSLVNIDIAEGDWKSARDRIIEIDTIEAATPPRFESHWTKFTIAQTRVRLLQAQGSWDTGAIACRSAIAAAINDGEYWWKHRLELLYLKGLVALRRFGEAAKLLGDLDYQPATLDTLVQLNSIVGFASLACGYSDLGRGLIHRAERISEASGNRYASTDGLHVQRALRVNMENKSAQQRSGSPDLETAVALIELGSHPHILAREVLAAIEAAGSAMSTATVVTGTNGARVIDVHGWTERDALLALRTPEQYDVLPLGDHGDEHWQLVVNARTELEHRCTVISLRKLITAALTLERFRREEQQRTALWPAEAVDGDPESIWASEQTSEVLRVARRIAPTALSVLVTGETGTGKEMLARAIHRASDRADKLMLAFNCTAVPRDMIESQLFGYRKGAFTGADVSFAGVIRAAGGGTLFLDEIAEVPLDVQPKLLRFLETHEIHPLGEPQPLKVDVRVIAATNAKLEQLVAEGRFREDLFYRLNVIRLKLPPLRERREEIPPIVDHYLRKYAEELNKGHLTLSDETLEYLLLYSWPGNLRQLANEVHRMVAIAERDSTLTPAQLSSEIQASRRTVPATPATDSEVRVRIDQPLPAAVQLLEKTMVKSALDKTHGRVEEAAKILGISRKGLFLKRRRWGLSNASSN